MFCDLVGSTALSEQHDPEDWREVVRAYQAAGARVPMQPQCSVTALHHAGVLAGVAAARLPSF
jgi:hypothetical protein